MYITSFQIENIRSIRQIDWELDGAQAPGWHVIIGDNGAGKSSLLRAVVLALLGPTEAMALRQDWGTWLRGGATQARVLVNLSADAAYDTFETKERPAKNALLPLGIVLEEHAAGSRRAVELKKMARLRYEPSRHVWGTGAGWFSASYGPFRRFSGGDKDYEKTFYANPKLGRHLSVFGENVALTECLEWLKDLHFKTIENRPEGRLLAPLTRFINQPGFLPHRARLKNISTEGVRFVDGNGCDVPVEQLSDGYRSILSMTFELIRQLSLAYGPARVFDPKDPRRVVAPGVVLIDEVDAHLHPTWQRRVGLWFREHFPNVQFLVTTHSPLVCQAADHGTVFRLPRPGGDDRGEMVKGIDLNRLLYGNVLDAYGTELFGADVTRSEVAKAKLARLAELNQKSLHKGLTAKERKEVQELRAMMPTAADTVRAHAPEEE
jgi:AAA domain, putative AbiEii toxin, Type IV TA system/AAA domain